MIDSLASNTIYNLIDSTFVVDSIFISNLSGLSFIDKGKTKTILQGQSNPFDDDPYLWSIKGFDLENADNITIKDIQIRRFRGFGIRVDAASSYFYAYNDSIVNCGWAAREDTSDTSSILIKSPCGVKLFGDDATFRRSYIMNSGWDGMQIAGYRITVDTTIIYHTGMDFPDAENQGDGVHMFKNPDPDSSYWVPYGEDSIRVWKTGQATFRLVNINTVEPKKSGIEGGWDSIYYDQDSIPYLLEKPLVQVTNSTVIGGKGIGITQDDHPRVGHFSTKIENCKIGSLDPSKPTFRIDWADALTTPTTAWIKNNTFYSPADYHPQGINCPVAEYYTDSTAVLYSNNNWRVGTKDSTSCVTHNLP